MAELLNAQTSLGSGGEHIVDSLLVITAVTFLAATFRALASGWRKTHPCFNFRGKERSCQTEEGQLKCLVWRKHESKAEEMQQNSKADDKNVILIYLFIYLF